MADPQKIPSPWHFPTPHEVLTALFVIAFSIRESGLLDDRPMALKAVAALYLACALAGVSAARQYLSPRIQSILTEHDKCNHPKEGE